MVEQVTPRSRNVHRAGLKSKAIPPPLALAFLLLLSRLLFPAARPEPPRLQENVPSRAQSVLTGEFFSHLRFLRDGRLSLGDELLVINGHLLVGLSHEEAVAILRSATGMVQLVVASKVGSFVCLFLKIFFMVVDLALSPLRTHPPTHTSLPACLFTATIVQCSPARGPLAEVHLISLLSDKGFYRYV